MQFTVKRLLLLVVTAAILFWLLGRPVTGFVTDTVIGAFSWKDVGAGMWYVNWLADLEKEFWGGTGEGASFWGTTAAVFNCFLLAVTVIGLLLLFIWCWEKTAYCPPYQQSHPEVAKKEEPLDWQI